MNRRSFLTALLGTPAVVALAGCGVSRQVAPGGTSDSTPSTPTSPGVEVDTDFVLRIAYEGGFVPADTIFTQLPTLLVTGDGRVFTPAAIDMKYPGPLVMPVMVGTITQAGLQTLVNAMDEAGLLGPVPDYALPSGVGIADAPDTAVTITYQGVTYAHRAYALGLDEPSTPDRDRLRTFVERATDLATLVGAGDLGPAEAYEPTTYRYRATVTDPAQWGDPKPTVVGWPSNAPYLSAAGTCATLQAGQDAGLFARSNQATLFEEQGVVYQVAVVVELPGDQGCGPIP